MEPNNNIDCSQYPDCGCVSSCREANSIALRDMVKRLNEPDLFEVVKEESKAPSLEAYHKSANCKSAPFDSGIQPWEVQPVERLSLGPVTVEEKQALEQSDWRPEVKLEQSELKKDTLGMKELLDIYQEMQTEEKAERAKIASERKKEQTKAILVVYSNVAAFKHSFDSSTDTSIRSHLNETADKFREILPSSIPVVSVPICSGDDRIEVIHL